MKTIISILIIFLFQVSNSMGWDSWLFKVNTDDIKMLADTGLNHPTDFIKKYKIKNMVNLSPSWRDSFLPPFADGTYVNFSDPFRYAKKYTYISIYKSNESYSNWVSISSPKTKKSFGVGWNFIKSKSIQLAVGYPSIIHHGSKVKLKKKMKPNKRIPRVTIGVNWVWDSLQSKTVQSTYIYITTKSTLKEIQYKMKTLNCYDAVVLDSKPFLYIDGKHVYSSDSNAVYPNVLTW